MHRLFQQWANIQQVFLAPFFFLEKIKKHLAISQTPTQSQWSTETWLVGHLTSASNCGKLLDLLCNCWKFCSHTSELSTFVLNIKNIFFTITLFIMLLMYIDTMDFKSIQLWINCRFSAEYIYCPAQHQQKAWKTTGRQIKSMNTELLWWLTKKPS